MSQQSQYSQAVLDSMQRIFGKGFLSPGGAEEIKQVVAETKIDGCHVLDLGCGLGGAAVVLAGDLDAGHVVGSDVEAHNLELARHTVAGAGLDHKITLRLVEPGPMPFDDGTFDVVFCKAMICHIEDKAGILGEVARVLKPDGVFVGADWMTGGDRSLSDEYKAWEKGLADAGLDFYFRSLRTHALVFESAGFGDVTFINASAPTAADAWQMQQEIEGDARPDLESALGSAGYAAFAERGRAKAAALDSGDLQYQFFTARLAGTPA